MPIASNKRPIASNKRLVALAAVVALGLVLAFAPAAAADAGDPLTYWGGPVAHSMTGVVVDWGSGVNSIYTNETTGDPGLIKYLSASSGSTNDISGVLAQYMDSSGANAAPNVSYGKQYQITPSVNLTTIYDGYIQQELVSQITNGHLPPPARGGLSTIYLLLIPPGHVVCLDQFTCSGQAFCAYHGNAAMPDGTPVLYAVLPDNTSGNMSQGCGTASTALANQTSFTSHEWAEAITDPLVAEATSDGPPLAWYDNVNCTSATAICGEIGDKCNALQTQNGGWTVQLEWSNLDSACVGTEPSYAAPTAAFAAASTAGSSAVVGTPVSFDGTSSSDSKLDAASIKGTNYSISPGIAGYSWNWGDGDTTSPNTGGTQTHTFNAPGTYQVSLTVTDNLGFTSTVTQAVEVSSTSPSAPVASTGTASAASATSETLNGTINTGGQPVTYSFAYGTSADKLDQSTPSAHLGPGVGPEPVSATATGLAASTTYYYQLVVQAGGNTYQAPPPVQSFTTSAASSSSSGGTGPGSGGSGSGSGSGGSGAGSQGSPSPAPTPTPTPTPAPGTPQLPGVSTGGISGLTSSGATASGSVDPNGSPTTYVVEYGTSTAYGKSSLPGSAGAGTSAMAVSATLSGLRARTVYHYRVVATSAAGTAVGADRTFKTPAAPPRAPRFSFTAPSRLTLAQALAGKLRVRFHCSTACTARFTVTIFLPGIKRLQAIPVTFARGSGRIGRAGTGQATLIFTSAARRTLRGARSVKLVISGYAVRGNSAPSTPRSLRLLLTR